MPSNKLAFKRVNNRFVNCNNKWKFGYDRVWDLGENFSVMVYIEDAIL